MKTKHNKKRNTAFVFEALVREATKAIIAKDATRKNKTLSILKEYFKSDNILGKELKCYKALLEGDELDQYTAEKMIFRATREHQGLDKKQIFSEQSKLINDINKSLGSSVFSNFVPNYKNYATVYQLFSDRTPIKKRVILEQDVLKNLSSKERLEEKVVKPIDTLVIKSFVKNFNQKYKALLPEQRELLSTYIVSLGDDIADFQLYLVEELSRIRNRVNESLKLSEVLTDENMVKNTNLVLERIDAINVSNITEKDIKNVLKLQGLVREYDSDATED